MRCDATSDRVPKLSVIVHGPHEVCTIKLQGNGHSRIYGIRLMTPNHLLQRPRRKRRAAEQER